MSQTSMSGSGSGPRPRGFLIGKVLRVVVWLLVVEVALQPVFAGQVLSGNAIGYAGHAMLGWLVIPLTALVLLVVSILAWRPGRGPGWVPLAAAGLLVALAAQITAGTMHLFALHVPLGVLIVVVTIWLVVGTRGVRPQAGPPRGRTAPAPTPGEGLRPRA